MKDTMMLKCECFNTTADTQYGKGKRPHLKMPQKEGPTLWMCSLCYYMRTKSEGLRSGEKKSAGVRK